jgi:2-dehydro-3-deoxygluconokinase
MTRPSSESPTFEVLCVGETMVMVTPAEAAPIRAETPALLRPGGAESNVAVHLAALGHAAAWAGQLGNDPFADLILGELRARGVDTSLARRIPGAPTGVYFKDPGPGGTAVYYYRTGSAASQMSPAALAGWPAHPSEIIHLSGITAVLSTDCLALMRHLIHDRPFDAVISFDVNHRPQLATADTPDVLLDLAQASDIVFVGRDEAQALWGTTDGASIRALVDKPAHLIVKDGGIDALDFNRNECTRVPSPRVTVLEAVGAGDAFAAGWLSGFLRNAPAATRLMLGHYVASRVLATTTDHAPLGSPAKIAAILERPTLEWNS